MLGFRPKLPVTDEQRLWIDSGFERLSNLLGRSRMVDAQVILPIAEYFPDPYAPTDEAVDIMFQRVCGYMQVDDRHIDLELFSGGDRALHDDLPSWHSVTSGAAGLYMSPNDQSHVVIAINSSKLNNPLTVVATLAHELAHVILLGGDLVDREAPDMEPLTDLTTVFLGMGVFTANAAAQFEQHQYLRTYSWSMQRLGYLSEEMFGYALAKFALARNESEPDWKKYLVPNIATYCKASGKWLSQNAPKC